MGSKASCLLALCALTVATTFACTDQPEPTMHPSGEMAGAEEHAIILAAGDIAGCAEHYQDEATAKLLAKLPGTILPLGDVVYQSGSRWQFRNCYHPSWGQFLSRTRPAPGNHEYRTNEAAPYFEYFGERAGPKGKGYYTYTLGTWRIYSLNSERFIAEQTTWLKKHLKDNPTKCVLAYWHKPLYSSGDVTPTPEVRPLFDALFRAKAEVVLTGHQHHYERFAPQDADSNRKARGVRHFVVGTGGAELRTIPTVAKNSLVRYNGGHGVLQMTLSPGKYSWTFLPVSGNDRPDTGSANCT